MALPVRLLAYASLQSLAFLKSYLKIYKITVILIYRGEGEGAETRGSMKRRGSASMGGVVVVVGH